MTEVVSDTPASESITGQLLAANRALAGCHRGERCFILAAGPSVARQDLRPLAAETCFAVTHFHQHRDYARIGPRYHCIAPFHQPISEENWQGQMDQVASGTGDAAMFFSLSDFERNQRGERFAHQDKYWLDFSGDWRRLLDTGVDLTRPLPIAQSVSVIPMLAALYMGFSRIYLVGFDCTWILKFLDRQDHFYAADEAVPAWPGFSPEYQGSVQEELDCMRTLWGQYKAIGILARRQGVEVVNATAGGLLDVYPRVDLRTVIGGGPVRKPSRSSVPTRDLNPGLEPVSRRFGFDRGTPLDRHYMARFIEANAGCIRGRVLEVGDNAFTRAFGRQVDRSDVLAVTDAPGATIVGDLATGANVPREAFDCIILTQTIQMIFDVRAALRCAVAALRPGGTLLLTASGISQISRYDMDRWGEFWRFTDRSLTDLLREAAPGADIEVAARGNVAAAKAFLDGLAAEELPAEVLEFDDPDYQVLLTARLTLAGAPGVETGAGKKAARAPVLADPLILLYHRVGIDPVDANLLAVTPAHFEGHLKVLAERFRVLPLGELIDRRQSGEAPADTVALTFDDGYLDNLTGAVPLLECHGLHATIFVTAAMVGADREFWWDALERLFFDTPVLPDRLEIGIDGRRVDWDLADGGGRLKCHDQLAALLRARPVAEIDAFVDRLYEWGGLARTARDDHRIVDAGQLRRLADSPAVEIGAHTLTHPWLAVLPAEAQRQEIATAKTRLEALIGRPVRLFSYPYGSADSFTDQTMRLVADAGYSAGIANIQGDLTPAAGRYALPRWLVRDWPPEIFANWLAATDKRGLERATLGQRAGRLTAAGRGHS